MYSIDELNALYEYTIEKFSRKSNKPEALSEGGRKLLDVRHSFKQATRLFRQIDEANQESERRFLAVWESAADAMALSISDGTVIAANPAYFQLYGYSPDEVIVKNYSIIFPPEQRAWANVLLSREPTTE